MDALDERILNTLQRDIPFITRPWREIAAQLKTDEDELLRRVKHLKKKGVIRRISATFDSRRVGFCSTLVAVKTGARDADKVAERLNVYPEITHNYARNSEYNIWFTLVAPTRDRIAGIIRQIKKDKDIESVLELPSTKIFKLKVSFNACSKKTKRRAPLKVPYAVPAYRVPGPKGKRMHAVKS